MDDATPKICIFCGSSVGNDPVYSNIAIKLAMILAHKGISLVYGGSSAGLMGIIADTMLEWGAGVYGVIPEMLVEKEVAHQHLTHQYIVSGMHERKALMSELCDAFLILPGGFGTMDELFESITWSQLDIHDKPIFMLNVNGYYNALLEWINYAVESGFINMLNGKRIIVFDSVPDCVEEIIARIGNAI